MLFYRPMLLWNYRPMLLWKSSHVTMEIVPCYYGNGIHSHLIYSRLKILY